MAAAPPPPPPPPQVDVYAPLPLNIAFGTDLDLDPTNWHWVHCLTLPLGKLNSLQFSQRPYKWIRYAIGVVIGAEGVLSTSCDSVDVLDYNAALPAESSILYYHPSDEERQRMFPLDPNIGRTHITSGSSVPTTRRAAFCAKVAEQDGRKCIISGFRETLCDAVHLVPHSKGDKYISTYTRGRSRDPTGGDIIQEIDSIRNGVLINRITHTVLGDDVAFLMTPNFAMNTTDIDPTAPPAEKRFTVHLFKLNDRVLLGDRSAPLGSVAQILDSPESPPDILFDTVYASAVLHHFGTQKLKDTVARTWKDTFYPGGVMTEEESKAIADERVASIQRAQERKMCCPDSFDMLMLLPYSAVPPHQLQAMLREAKEKAEAARQRNVEEKVGLWLKQVTAA